MRRGRCTTLDDNSEGDSGGWLMSYIAMITLLNSDGGVGGAVVGEDDDGASVMGTVRGVRGVHVRHRGNECCGSGVVGSR